MVFRLFICPGSVFSHIIKHIGKCRRVCYQLFCLQVLSEDTFCLKRMSVNDSFSDYNDLIHIFLPSVWLHSVFCCFGCRAKKINKLKKITQNMKHFNCIVSMSYIFFLEEPGCEWDHFHTDVTDVRNDRCSWDVIKSENKCLKNPRL